MISIEEYEALRIRPTNNPVFLQKWRSLLFMHFSCDPAEIQKLLPEGLTVDTYPDESGVERAWVGVVPFRMEAIKRVGLPPIPGFSAFPETNVRTYVHKDGREPGLWFFSLDASSSVACATARQMFKLPYHHAKMRVDESREEISYACRRLSNGSRCNVKCSVVSPRPLLRSESLDFFLIERYIFYAVRDGRLLAGRVHHKPYPTYSVKVESIDETLVEAAGIAPRPFEHQLFSYGVDVEIFPFGK